MGGPMKSRLFATVILVIMMMTACGPSAAPAGGPTPDVAAVRTSAASTVVSQFTLTAAAFTPNIPSASSTPTTTGPTDTPQPEITSTPTTPTLPVAQVTNAEGTVVALCDKYSWDPATVDVNIPDNTPMSPGQDFTKTWKIKNIGACTWGEGYKMVFSYGDKMSGVAQPLSAAIAPGQEADVSVQFTAPDLPGKYFSVWTLENAKGIPFQGNDNKALYVQVVVQ